MDRQSLLKASIAAKDYDFSNFKEAHNYGTFKCNKLMYLDFNAKYPDVCTDIYEMHAFISMNAELYVEKSFCKCGNRMKVYKHYCSRQCFMKYGMNSREAQYKAEQTKLARYGATHNWAKNSASRKELNQRMIEKYGVAYGLQSSEIRGKIAQTNVERYGTAFAIANKDIRAKANKTIQDRYGVDNVYQSEEVKDTIKQTCLQKYGVEYAFQAEEVKQHIRESCFEHYGVEHPSQSEEIKQRIIQTNIKKYGVPCSLSSEHVLHQLRKKRPQTLAKIHKTKRKNGTFNTSKPEKRCYAATLSKFSDAKTQYKEDRYPFLCDIYIPSKDLFIELQFSWTHGGKPFTNSNECKQRLQAWAAHNTQYYRNAIDTWTKRDAEKRQTAKENKLNYLEFFYEEDFMSWLDSQS